MCLIALVIPSVTGPIHLWAFSVSSQVVRSGTAGQALVRCCTCPAKPCWTCAGTLVLDLSLQACAFYPVRSLLGLCSQGLEELH